MKTITKEYKLYSFNELSEEAKERALRDWNDNDDMPFLEDNMQDECEELLKEYEIEGTPELQYSLGYSQGDGVQFVGRFEWQGLDVRIEHDGHYCHSYCKTLDVLNADGEYMEDKEKEFEEIYQKICKSLEDFGYKFIEYDRSEECFKENCEANDYTFLENGTMFNA
jgi:hypothetical protein